MNTSFFDIISQLINTPCSLSTSSCILSIKVSFWITWKSQMNLHQHTFIRCIRSRIASFEGLERSSLIGQDQDFRKDILQQLKTNSFKNVAWVINGVRTCIVHTIQEMMSKWCESRVCSSDNCANVALQSWNFKDRTSVKCHDDTVEFHFQWNCNPQYLHPSDTSKH